MTTGQAFVGHFGSAVSISLYNFMCFHYSTHTNKCPPAADIREIME